ncbi:MAG: hypothetical protein Q9191_001519, partial [Dirinaria sp. TL-2023a]
MSKRPEEAGSLREFISLGLGREWTFRNSNTVDPQQENTAAMSEVVTDAAQDAKTPPTNESMSETSATQSAPVLQVTELDSAEAQHVEETPQTNSESLPDFSESSTSQQIVNLTALPDISKSKEVAGMSHVAPSCSSRDGSPDSSDTGFWTAPEIQSGFEAASEPSSTTLNTSPPLEQTSPSNSHRTHRTPRTPRQQRIVTP